MTLDDEPQPTAIQPVFAAPFSMEAVTAAIRADLDTSIDIPAEHRGATVFFLNQDKLEVAVATRVVSTDRVMWDIEGIVTHPWTGGRTGFGVLNKITW